MPGLALVIVAVSTLTQPYGPARNLVDITVALVVAVATFLLWHAAARSSRARPRLLKVLPYALALMTMTSGAASLTNSGGPFSLLSSLATTIAGSTFSLGVATAITATGALWVLSIGLAYDVSTWGTFGYPLVMVFSLMLGRLLHGYRVHAEQSAALMANLKQLQAEQNRAAALDERNRIAREIHDVLAHSLGSLGVQIQAAQALLTDQGDIERAVAILSQARRAATDGLTETRRALQALRADTPPLPDALANLGANHQRHYAARVDFDLTGQPRALSADANLALTRTAQEALVNTAKHAPHEPVRITLDYRLGCTMLSVANPFAASSEDCRRAGVGQRRLRTGGDARTAAAHRRLPVRRARPRRLGRHRAGPAMRDSTGPLRIVVADDQASVREGLVVLLDLLPDIEVVGSAANGQEAIDLVGAHHPDAILLDLHMPVLDGVQATRVITSEHPEVAIVVLTTYADDASVLAALGAGRPQLPDQGRRPGRHRASAARRRHRPGRARPCGPGHPGRRRHPAGRP